MAIPQSEESSAFLKRTSLAILKLPETAFEAMLADLEKLMSVSSTEEATAITDGFCQLLGIDEGVVNLSIGWITVVSQVAVEKGLDEARAFAKAASPEKDADEYIRRAERVISVANDKRDAVKRLQASSRTVRGLLPYFEAIQATVELRAVFSGDGRTLGHLHLGAERIVDLAPMASIAISLDSGFPNHFVFQVGREDLDRLVSALLEATEKIDELSNFVSQRTLK